MITLGRRGNQEGPSYINVKVPVTIGGIVCLFSINNPLRDQSPARGYWSLFFNLVDMYVPRGDMHRVFDKLSPAPHTQPLGSKPGAVCGGGAWHHVWWWGVASSDTERQADEGYCIKPWPFSISSSLVTLSDASISSCVQVLGALKGASRTSAPPPRLPQGSSTEGGQSPSLPFPETWNSPEKTDKRRAWTGPAPTACPLIFRAVQVALADLHGRLIAGRASDPRNGWQVLRGCFGHR